jgi:hypothetical protein
MRLCGVWHPASTTGLKARAASSTFPAMTALSESRPDTTDRSLSLYLPLAEPAPAGAEPGWTRKTSKPETTDDPGVWVDLCTRPEAWISRSLDRQ